jgi:hypothetical protein
MPNFTNFYTFLFLGSFWMTSISPGMEPPGYPYGSAILFGNRPKLFTCIEVGSSTLFDKIETSCLMKQLIKSRVVDCIDLRIRIQFRIQGFDEQKLTKNYRCKTFFIFFWTENCNLLILRPS